MWSLILFFVCIIGLAVEIGWKECNWGYLIAIGVFFGIALLCYADVPVGVIVGLCIGIPVLIIVRQSGKSNSSNTTSETKVASIDDFASKYAISIAEQEQIKTMITDGVPEIQELSSELREIGIVVPTRPMLLWGYLAKRGKIPWRYTWDNANYEYENILRSFGDGVNTDVACKYRHVSRTEALAEVKSSRLKFLKWYDKEIQEHGMQYELLYIKGNNAGRGNVEYAKSIQECTRLDDDVVAFWMPMRKLVDLI